MHVYPRMSPLAGSHCFAGIPAACKGGCCAPPFDPPSGCRMSGTETRQRVKRLPPVRCTADEFAAVTAKADAAGMTVCQYLRQSAIENAASGPKPRRRQPHGDLVELARISGLLGKYGSNVNQLAHVANMDGDRLTEGQLYQIAAEVREVKLAVLKVIGRGD